MKNPAEPVARRKTKRAGESGPEPGKLTIRLVRSGICTPKDQKATLQALGFRRREQEVVRADDPAVRGMIRKVRHLVEVETGSER
ncbi:MAG: 50S ribosomal protein L30 [Thermoanaerobaculia bacterium]